MTTNTDPDVNAAPDVAGAALTLVEALYGVAAIEGFRHGLDVTITYTATHLDLGDPSHYEAEDALSVWRALADLVTAVQTCRGGS